MTDTIFERVIFYDEYKEVQIRLTINEFREIEYMHLRKYYLDFEGDWLPSSEGISMPIDLNNVRELFIGLTEILSLGESKSILEDHFKEALDNLYLR